MTFALTANRAASRLGLTSVGIAVILAAGCSAPIEGDGVVAITNVNVITMVGDEILFDHTVLLAGGHILALGPAGTIDVPNGVLEVDGRGSYLIPGLWDMHVHIFGPTMESDLFPALLAHGVTGVRDMNGAISLDSIQQLKANIRDGSVLGPTIVAPGPLIDAPGRSADEMSPAIREVDSPEEARSTVRELAGLGADFIKLYNRLTVPLLDALLQEADAAGIPVVGHVPMATAASRLSAAGMTSQEHLQGILEESSVAGDEFREFVGAVFQGTPDREMIARFVELRARMVNEYDSGRAAKLFAVLAREGTAIVPTLVSNRGLLLTGLDASLTSDPRWLAMPDDIKATWSQPNRLFSLLDDALKRRWYDRLFEIVGQLEAHGVALLAGTDLGVNWVYAGSSLHDELELMVEAGLEPHRALAAATSTPARVLGFDDRGTIELGKVADLVLLGSNPFDDIGAVRDIQAVILGGRVLDIKGTSATDIN